MTEVIKVEVVDLQWTQEETDTRMLLHVAHTADLGAPAVLIKSSDSDVHGCHYSVSQSPDQHSTDLSNRNVDLTAIGRGLRQKVCSTLPRYHAFSGCL